VAVRRMRTHGLNPRSMFMCRFKTRAFEIYATLPAGPKDVIPTDDTRPIRSLDSTYREPRSWRTIITG